MSAIYEDPSMAGTLLFFMLRAFLDTDFDEVLYRSGRYKEEGKNGTRAGWGYEVRVGRGWEHKGGVVLGGGW